MTFQSVCVLRNFFLPIYAEYERGTIRAATGYAFFLHSVSRQLPELCAKLIVYKPAQYGEREYVRWPWS